MTQYDVFSERWPAFDGALPEADRGNLPASEADLATVTEQLGRPVRGVVEIAARYPDGEPIVVKTLPLLPDGTPFPTVYYLTSPAATAAVSQLEANGLMKEWSEALTQDQELAAHYARAHEQYLGVREALGQVPQIAGISAGGMPTRVKCLHVLVGHALAAGPGVNPLGDAAISVMAGLGTWRPDRPAGRVS